MPPALPASSRGSPRWRLLALALGIGATTTIFSVIQNVLLDPVPLRHSDRVVSIQIRDLSQQPPGRPHRSSRCPSSSTTRPSTQVFEDVIAGGFEDVLYSAGGGDRAVLAAAW